MLSFQIKRIISSEKWLYYVATYFFENAKKFGSVGRHETEKKRGWPNPVKS